MLRYLYAAVVFACCFAAASNWGVLYVVFLGVVLFWMSGNIDNLVDRISALEEIIAKLALDDAAASVDRDDDGEY